MADLPVGTIVQRRSSSRTSSCSRRSQKAKSGRPKSYKRSSTSSTAATPADLTSFPSLSPDNPPEELPGRATINETFLQTSQPDPTVESADVLRDRKAALDKLTSTLSQSADRAALFDDSVSSPDIPGALHLADDAHIDQLIDRTGANQLVRRFARDLALRDAEISELRRRADARERALKRMLREVSVSSQDIERRLYQLENSNHESPTEGLRGDGGVRSSSINGLLDQAMLDEVGDHVPDSLDLRATVRPHRFDSDEVSGTSSIESGRKKKQRSIRTWQDYLFGSASGSRKTSGASSVVSDMDDTEDDAPHPRVTSNHSIRRKLLDEELFQPPHERARSPALGPGGKQISQNPGDNDSLHSRKSSKSFSSWTVKLFSGATREAGSIEDGRPRGSSMGQDNLRAQPAIPNPIPKGSMSAVAALKRINSYTAVQSSSGRSTATPSPSNRLNPQTVRKITVSSQTPAYSNTDRSMGDHSNVALGPVEMDAILPMESRPPSLTYSANPHQPGELLTDRFGFIYDQRRKKRQRDASLPKKNKYRNSLAETISSFRSDPADGLESEIDSISPVRDTFVSPPRSPTPVSIDEGENDLPVMRRWQDYLRIATRPTELLSHTPSAGPIISLTTGEESKLRNPSVAIDKDGTVSVGVAVQPSATTSNVVADTPEFAGTSTRTPLVAITKITANDQEPVKMLLEQLTELHDSLQRERTAKWNEFLRKVRAERRREGEAAAAQDPDRANLSLAMPEVSLTDGEVVGISGLGNKGKVGRAKWREFRSLVLGGIPVAHRAKIWAECSGASAMRIPGYYEDLVTGPAAVDPDLSVVAQIDMDINRTLTDNIFFRKGPGVPKLKEVLLAYSRRNPEVGYCQGMNLIAASLLLITPTTEDSFWLLVSIIENILPKHYYDHGLMASRADQQVLRQYISDVLPKLSSHLEDLGVELEALTFQWFLSIFTDCLSAEALYRVWDVVFCLNATSTASIPGRPGQSKDDASSPTNSNASTVTAKEEETANSGGGSTFLFQVALALLKLNEQPLLACSTPAAVYTYINHQMTNHAISIDGLIQASEALRNLVRREDVVARRVTAVRQMRRGSTYHQDRSRSISPA